MRDARDRAASRPPVRRVPWPLRRLAVNLCSINVCIRTTMSVRTTLSPFDAEARFESHSPSPRK
ncbi:MAG: hypothetical protein ACLQRH_01435 [Acidimicrobiales bacterium]